MGNTGAGYQQWQEAVQVGQEGAREVVVGERVWSLLRTFRCAEEAEGDMGIYDYYEEAALARWHDGGPPIEDSNTYT